MPTWRERMLPMLTGEGAFESDEEVNARLRYFTGLGGPDEVSIRFTHDEDAAWRLVDYVIKQGWRVTLWCVERVFTAECAADGTPDAPLKWVPQTRPTRAKALAHAIYDSLARASVEFWTPPLGPMALCPYCRGMGMHVLHPTQVAVLDLLREVGPATAGELYERDPSRSQTSYNNALERLRTRGMARRRKRGARWVYQAIEK